MNVAAGMPVHDVAVAAHLPTGYTPNQQINFYGASAKHARRTSTLYTFDATPRRFADWSTGFYALLFFAVWKVWTVAAHSTTISYHLGFLPKQHYHATWYGIRCSDLLRGYHTHTHTSAHSPPAPFSLLHGRSHTPHTHALHTAWLLNWTIQQFILFLGKQRARRPHTHHARQC